MQKHGSGPGDLQLYNFFASHAVGQCLPCHALQNSSACKCRTLEHLVAFAATAKPSEARSLTPNCKASATLESEGLPVNFSCRWKHSQHPARPRATPRPEIERASSLVRCVSKRLLVFKFLRCANCLPDMRLHHDGQSHKVFHV